MYTVKRGIAKKIFKDEANDYMAEDENENLLVSANIFPYIGILVNIQRENVKKFQRELTSEEKQGIINFSKERGYCNKNA